MVETNAVRPLPRVGDPERMGTALWKNSDLSSVASSLHWEIVRGLKETPAAIFVTSADGVVVDVFFSRRGKRIADETGLMVGVNLDASQAGPNAVALALAERATVTVHGDEHAIPILKAYTTAATPLLTSDQQIVGALALIVPKERFDQEMVMTLAAAGRAVETQLRKDFVRDVLNWMVTQEWNRFVDGRKTQGIVSADISDSWRRSRKWKIDVDAESFGSGGRISDEELEARRQANALLLEVARPLMEQVSVKVNESGCVVMLTDADGIVLDLFANLDDEARRAYNFYAGCSFHERHCGTNGWGTPLIVGKAMSVVGAENYMRIAKEWGTAGAPVRDPEGRIIGGLAVGVPYRLYHGLIFGLVISAADAIEKELRLRQVTWRMDLMELVREIHESLDLSGTLARVARRACHISGDEICAVIGFPGSQGGPGFFSAYPEFERSIIREEALEREAALSGTVARVIQRSRMTEVLDRSFILRHGLRTALVVPLVEEGKRIGLLFLAGRRQRYPSELIHMITVFAEQGAIAIKNARLHESVGEAALIDPLTGLYNRKGLETRLRSGLADEPFGLIYVDVDDFKRINDTYGHAVGDEVLKRVAGCIQQASRSSDLTVRMGGEEFLIVLPQAGVEAAATAGERVRRAVEAMEVYGVTVSVGVAGSAPGARFDEVLAWADAELYRAKQAGRNRVCIAQRASLENHLEQGEE